MQVVVAIRPEALVERGFPVGCATYEALAEAAPVRRRRGR